MNPSSCGRALRCANLVWRDEQPFAADFDDIYHAADGAAETQRVFIEPANLAQRWARQADFCVAELGFGTGLNLVALLARWRAAPGTRLHYLSFEQHPLSLEDWAKVCSLRQTAHPEYAQLRGRYPPAVSGWHQRSLDNGRITLSLYWGDAATGLADLQDRLALPVDAWWLDGFAPDKNPALWQPGLFAQLAGLSTRGTSVTTFTAAGRVRRALADVGFRMRRVDHSHLPTVEEVHTLPADQQCCPSCHHPFAPFPGTDDAEELHVAVKAHRRVIRRARYKRTCQCETTPRIVAAPGPAKLIPKGKIGVSIWVHVLLGKYLYGQPVHRQLGHLKNQGLHLPPGTITDGLQRIEPLLQPPYQALIERQRPDGHWHADETRWRVFEPLEGKPNYLWVLWVFHSTSAVVFLLKPSRAGQVIKDHLGEAAQGVLSVDRYRAYRAVANETKLDLSLCWAHVRRDFINLARSEPENEAWALEWVDAIGHLYSLNAQRLEAQTDSVAYPQAQAALEAALEARMDCLETQLAQPLSTTTQEGVLKSLQRHWDGLRLFVDYPFLPMDNNTAERALRGPVVGRKNYYGSGAQWSGRLAASMFSLTQTLLLYGLNPHLWLTAYLQACAQAGGVPQTVEAFLPWNLSQAQRQTWAIPDALDDSS